ncbi:ankyrin repeat protein [Jatrophihabitans sp. GAS493]|uniref:ankyrin repeat domain-containing protein n=1 Tax=Jatrophihabitans sp. GAS493 TaxID=1907575 RepID=UPI000BB994FC|nr:ankyrin repeat domain-containing protein [Jatrophihabitans sp. GAS493]SOD71006.1 ankyrin repeat protein [Jatrophihabitans sp. GAS493]
MPNEPLTAADLQSEIDARSWFLTPAAAGESQADSFLRLAILNFDSDGPGKRAEAARQLAEQPDLPAADIAVAAAVADVPSVRRILEADPPAATRPTGPYGWSPLMYQAYARLDAPIGRSATIETTRLLIEAGADPNDGRFFLGLATPFTVLTGVFGSADEQRPAHPQAAGLGRTLLEFGAAANDAQTLYNRMFQPDDDHLRLLFEFGLGQNDPPGVWHQLLGDALDSPAAMVGSVLSWAVTHDQRERVALLAEQGVDVSSPTVRVPWSRGSTSTPIALALTTGNAGVAALLRDLGVPEAELDGVDSCIAALLAADAGAVEAIEAVHPGVLAATRERRPALVVWAAGRGRSEVVELLVSKGFSVNALGRADVAVDQPWQTALHTAAGDGDAELVQTLLTLGADRALRDRRFDSTPLEWAEHFDHQQIIDVLKRE